jgi:hypothetical protein
MTLLLLEDGRTILIDVRIRSAADDPDDGDQESHEDERFFVSRGEPEPARNLGFGPKEAESLQGGPRDT